MHPEPAADQQAPDRSWSWDDALLPSAAGLLVLLAYLPGSGRALDYDSSQTVGSYVRTSSLLDPFRSQRLFNNHPMFSFVEHLVYTVTGSAEEWVLRLAPLTFAACAVALAVAALRRPLGTLPAACGGLVLATNPTVIELSRSVRGYSLLLLCGIASTWALASLLRSSPAARGRRGASTVYVLTVAIGVATHLYMVPIVLGHVAVVVVRRGVEEPWVFRWLAGLLLGASAYVAMLPDLVDAVQAGSRTFKPEFPWDLAEVIVGSGLAALLIAVVVVVGAAYVLPVRFDLSVAALVVGGAIAVTWLVTASVHLEARFHVWLVPAASGLAAVAVRRHQALAVLVVAGAALNVWSVRDGYLEDPNVQPELAALLDRAAMRGETGCVTSFSVLPILGYTSSFRPVVEPAELAGCDLVAVPFPNLDGELARVAGRLMPARARYDAWFEDGLAFASDPSYFEDVCLEGDPVLCPP